MAFIDRVMCPDSVERSLLSLAVAADTGLDGREQVRVPVLGRRPHEDGTRRGRALASDARDEALPSHAAARLDADAVAAWIVGQYRGNRYPAVVLGSPHGGAVHLAAALGAAWLPSTFPVTVGWPDGSPGDWVGAMRWGAEVAGRILAANPAITIRQVHDPIRRGLLCGSTVTLYVRWRRLAAAYREFIRGRLAPDGTLLILRDARTWPVLDGAGTAYTFQIGGPSGGLPPENYTLDHPSFERLMSELGIEAWLSPPDRSCPRYAETAGEPAFDGEVQRFGAAIGHPVRQVLYPRAEALSAFTADAYRLWLRSSGRAADHCVIETGRLLDPRQTLLRGMVPFWCESATPASVEAAEWWLAGSESFEAVTVLPDPPGIRSDTYVTAGHWNSLAWFGRHRGHADRLAVSRYPLLPLPSSRAASVLSTAGRELRPAIRLPVTTLLSRLENHSGDLGLFFG